MENQTKILVIGAGPSGLSTLKALDQLQPKEQYKIVCYQKQDNMGGQWNFTMESGVDKYGEPIHSGMYSQLWTNAPKECFQYSDYTYHEHFGKPVPAYLPRDMFTNYVLKRFQRYDLRKYIKFSHAISNVKFNEASKKFQVVTKNLKENKLINQEFDYVCVATGHYSYPRIPKIQGQQKFKGKMIHSHDIREFTQFKDKNVLVVGSFMSAQDMVLQCYKFGAKNIIWNHKGLRIPYDKTQIPKTIEFIQGLQYVDQETAYFSNGEKRQIDAIIFGTGYRYYYPFLQQNLRLPNQKTRMWQTGLHQSVIWQKNPQLFYIGMANFLMTLAASDIQAYLVRDVISKKYKVPDFSTPAPQDIKRQQQTKNAKSFIQLLKCICAYLTDLMRITNYPAYNIYDVVPLMQSFLHYRVINLMKYRDSGTFKSMFTGQQSCLPNKAWIQLTQIQQFDPNSKQQLRQFFQF